MRPHGRDLRPQGGHRPAAQGADRPRRPFLDWQECFCASPGTCSMMGTANTMGCFLEATGLAPFGSATMLAYDAAKLRQARDVGERIVTLVEEGPQPRRFLHEASLENGIKVCLGFGRFHQRRAAPDGPRLCYGRGPGPGAVSTSSRLPCRWWPNSSPRRHSTSTTITGPAACWPCEDHRETAWIQDVPLAMGGSLGAWLERPAASGQQMAPACSRIMRPASDPWHRMAVLPSCAAIWLPQGRWSKRAASNPP